MYNNAAIQALEARVGWAEPVPPCSIVISLNNKVAQSGRYVNGFHKLATVEKVYSTQENENVSDADFQKELDKLRRSAVLKVLNAIYDVNILANRTTTYVGIGKDLSGTDYSPIIISRANVFDNAIGYQLAFDVLQMQATTTRSNGSERAIHEAYTRLQVELEGSSSSETSINTKGIERRLRESIQQAIDILFPQPKGAIQNASFLW